MFAIGVGHTIFSQDIFDAFCLLEGGCAGGHVAIDLHTGEVSEWAEVGHVPYVFQLTFCLRNCGRGGGL